MEPQDNADYGKLSYWDARYKEEESYDWFTTVYDECVAAVFASIETVYEKQKAIRDLDGASKELTVLHLGVGNSSICSDLRKMHAAKYQGDPVPYTLVQIAVDYSEVVIAKMKARDEKQASIEHDTGGSSRVHWEVADVRNMASVRAKYGPCFDVIVDKATMDALQADKENDAMEDDIDAMLLQVSRCLCEAEESGGEKASDRYRQFLQVTWEVPYYRLHYTTRNERHDFAWGGIATHRFIGSSDMYRLYTYEVQPRSDSAICGTKSP